MKKIIESVKLYKGRHDLNQVKKNETLVGADEYGKTLLGKIFHIAQEKQDEQIYSFPYFTNPQARHYRDCYIYGAHYFFRNEDKVYALGELSSYLGIAVGKINFGGYLVHPQYGVRGLIGVGESLYLTNIYNQYAYIGKKNDFLDKKYISIFYAGLYYIAIDNDRKYHVAVVSYEADMKPVFNIDEDTIFISKAAELINPVCGSTMLYGGKYMTYYANRSGSYSCIDNTGDSVSYSFGKFNVDFDNLKNNLSENYNYSINNDNIALPYKIVKIQDGIQSYYDYGFNEKRQLKEINEQINGWNDNLTQITSNLVKKIMYTYVWEDSTVSYYSIAQKSVALLSNISEQILNSTGQNVEYNKVSSLYQVRKDIDNDERLVYLSSSGQDGLLGTNKIKLNEIVLYNQSGSVELVGGVSYGGVTGDGFRLYSQSIYSDKKSDMLLASFDGIYYDGNEKCMSAYTAFESYENVEVVEGKIITDHYILENAIISGRSLWGNKTAYFPTEGYIKLKDQVYVNSSLNVTYVVFCVMQKEGDNNNWTIEQTYINAQNLPSSKVIKTISAGTYVEMILFKSSNCESKVYIYDPITYKLKGYINNNFVPIMQVRDEETGIVNFSYQYLLEEHNGHRIIRDKLIINPICLYGYAMLGGYSKISSPKCQKERHNTIVDIRCRENAQIIFNGNIYTVNSTSVLIMGNGRATVEFGGLDGFTFEWNTNSITIYKNKLVCAQKKTDISIDHKANWVIGTKGEILFVILNGKLICSLVISENPFFYVTVLEKKLTPYSLNNKLILIQNFDIAINYYDYLGRLVQTQSIKIMYNNVTRLISNMYFYNRANQVVAYTLKGAYPIDKETRLNNNDKPLLFRENCANIDWSLKTSSDERGQLIGEIADYYKTGMGKDFAINFEDYKYPYIYEKYETSGASRFVLEMSPGIYGNENLEVKKYQDVDMFDSIIHSITRLDANYNTDYNTIKISDQTIKLMDINMYDSNKNRLAKTHKSSLSDTDISYKIKNGIMSNAEIANNTLGIGNTFYKISDSTKMIEQFKIAFNRIQIHWGINDDYKILITDVSGNGRLVFQGKNISMDLCVYFKYDKRNRMVEMGTVSFQDVTWQEILNLTMDPTYPYNGAVKVRECNVLAEYQYDLEAHGYSLGRLCKYIMNDSTYVHEYMYDQMGRVCKQISLLNGNKTEQIITKDNLSNLKHVEYKRNTDMSVFLNYSYIDNNIKEIEYKTGVLSHLVLSTPEYDIFNRLLKYTDCNGCISEIKYDFLGRQIMMKVTDKNQQNYSVEKKYTLNNGTYERLNEVKYEPEGYIRQYTYDEYLRLKSVTDKETSLKYDKSGNLLEYYMGENRNILQYAAAKDQLIKAGEVNFLYDTSGKVLQKNGNLENLRIQYDTLFPLRVTSIAKLSLTGEARSIYSFHYNMFSQIANMIFSIPDAQTTISYHYLYSEDGRLEQTEAVTFQNRSYESYIYAGNRLIAMHETGDKWYGLMYDDAETLYITTKETSVMIEKYNAWGMPEYQNLACNCCYRGMNYIDDLNLYVNNGALYDPAYGITYVPIMENESYTPYRIKNNVPFI